MTNDRTLPLATTAEMIGIKAGTLRRWCAYHSDHLSTTANPPTGQPRRFTNRDVEILRYVQDLRSQGLTVDSINSQLGLLTFPDVDESEEQSPVIDSTQLTSMGSLEGLQQAPGVIVALEAMQRQIDAIQQANRGRFDTVTVLGIGICIGLLFAVCMIVLAWLYGG
jgi:DNA-binding transcriptional MerR regulator